MPCRSRGSRFWVLELFPCAKDAFKTHWGSSSPPKNGATSHLDFDRHSVLGFIHVHHLRQLSDIRKEYLVDPIKDLRPVCPNCHAVLHLRNPAYSIEDVLAFLAAD